MLITPEVSERLKKNLIFDGEAHDALGVMQILFRNETPESAPELLRILQVILKSDMIIMQSPAEGLRELESDRHRYQTALEAIIAEVDDCFDCGRDRCPRCIATAAIDPSRKAD